MTPQSLSWPAASSYLVITGRAPLANPPCSTPIFKPEASRFVVFETEHLLPRQNRRAWDTSAGCSQSLQQVRAPESPNQGSQQFTLLTAPSSPSFAQSSPAHHSYVGCYVNKVRRWAPSSPLA